MINAGKYNKRIIIYKVVQGKDSQGFPTEITETVLSPFAMNSDVEKAYTNFRIRYSKTVVDAYYDSVNSNREMLIDFNNKNYKVEYLNNVDEANIELEMQAKEVLK